MKWIKNIFITLLIGLCSGIGGAWLFSNYNTNNEAAINYKLRKIQNRLEKKSDSYRVNYSSSRKANKIPDKENDFISASAEAKNSVVYVKTISSSKETYNWFDYYFYGRGKNKQVISSGSGVIFSKDGYIITNNHVINEADNIKIIHQNKNYKAKIIGSDPSTDIAVLKVDGNNMPAIKLGNSDKLQVGEWVLAVGNPFNLTSTVTAGIVSAKERSINAINSQFPIESFIQTDAAINPGNSGGALVNKKGELVGINTAILSKTGSYAGYGFAVPVKIVKKVVKDIIKYGHVQKAYFGADVMKVNKKISKKIDINKLKGVLITYILDGGAADKAGLEKGDVILEINGKKINSKADFNAELSYFRPGDKVNVKYIADGNLKEKTITLLNENGTTEKIKKTSYNSKTLGAKLESVPEVQLERMGIQGGVRVISIKSGLLSRLNIPEGFIITAINNQSIDDPEELEKILKKIRGSVVIQGVTKNGRKVYRSFYIH